MQSETRQRANSRRLQTGRKWFAMAGALAAGLIVGRAPAQAGSIGVSRAVAGGVSLLVLTVDLNDPNVKVTGVMAQNGVGHAEKFESMIHRTHPTAAVTGTYFCEQTLLPIGDLVVNGHLAHRGGVGTGLAITDDNQCDFVRPPHNYSWVNWGAYDFVCCAGPRLVTEGQAGVHPGPEGFHDPHVLGRASRLAVGLTARHKLLFVATRTPVQLSKLAKAMQKLGCIDAMNLDAGSSLAFYNGGKVHIAPHRKLTNLILIYDDRQRYARFKSRLTAPTSVARK